MTGISRPAWISSVPLHCQSWGPDAALMQPGSSRPRSEPIRAGSDGHDGGETSSLGCVFWGKTHDIWIPLAVWVISRKVTDKSRTFPCWCLWFCHFTKCVHHETHGRSAGSCCGAGTAGSCPTSRRAGPAERRPCRLCTATETSRRVRPSAPATTRKPEEDESGRKVKELNRKLCQYYYYKLYFHREQRDLVFASTFQESCM